LDPFYQRAGEGLLVPTELAYGPPWLPGTQHGSMVAALMARAVEATPSAVAMHLTRLGVDLSRPVPLGRTRVDAEVTREGRRLQMLALTLVVDDRVQARGTATRIRVSDGVIQPGDMPAPWPDDAPVGRPGDQAVPSPLGADLLWDAHQARWQAYSPGAGTVWLRPQNPLVEGEPLTPTVRAALVADLVMTAGGIVPPERYVVVNPDLTLALARLPDSEWIELSSCVRLDGNGVGISDGALFDERGWIGTAVKSLLAERRPPR
jgi:hypothetical protein